jgi:hypothetical protein
MMIIYMMIYNEIRNPAPVQDVSQLLYPYAGVRLEEMVAILERENPLVRPLAPNFDLPEAISNLPLW